MSIEDNTDDGYINNVLHFIPSKNVEENPSYIHFGNKLSVFKTLGLINKLNII